MIKKERKKPLKVISLEAILGRLPLNYQNRPYIEDELGKAMAGWRGEQAIDFHLSFLPKEQTMILHDLRLEDNENRFFQIDTVLLSSKFHLILEVKNMAGTLYFNNDPQQLVQKLNNEEKAYQCPILLVERQRLQLQTFLKKFQIPEVPILTLVVISHANSVIKFAPNFYKAKQCVIHAAAIPDKISGIKAPFKNEILSQKELKKAARILVKNHQPLNKDYLEHFNIPKSDILPGVHCPKCRNLPMERKRGYWLCPSCQHSSKNAHIAAIYDYSLLINSKITNQAIREFLHLQSIFATTKLLNSLNLKKEGQFKGRSYFL
ncbi:NERD domain-containing protein [Anaerobacillus isosaccharinicus]|uniref:NERD domain-containing protein n=1 Tax=Anaerobacillus isosaccharinicus TaxID=1532552 RepID=A0A1S2LZ19_9BACI|nr:nuclease-related domain-containing protein [Anaerobacillus isosaccharinicus]MBA5584468.1 NERD domain-containing protein [Anaerobacillus isosaccharinicus]QOY37145.1 NERD domain-containing protein [Anaerobacillus isosaccharinicus]